MAKTKTTEVQEDSVVLPAGVSADALAAALQALADSTRAQADAASAAAKIVKKTTLNRKHNSPFDPKDGKAKARFKRKTYLHSLALDEKFHTNDEIEAANKLRPGSYCDGLIRVTRRKDKGIDIDWPVKTAAQRLRLATQYGLTTFKDICERCITEAAQPKRSSALDDDE